jgi:uncharacterized membrane protein YecN with MAPEG domain
MMVLPVTLSSAAAAALLAFWLSQRVFRLRLAGKVLHGDGGNPALARRMRAQLNFVEYTPFVLFLIAAIELSGRGGRWLAIVGAAYFVARIAHALGMDSDTMSKLRMVGMWVTFLTLIGLAIYAALIAGGVV